MTSSSLAPLIDSNNLKRCSKCGETKPREAFSRDRRNRDGLQGECKACNAAYRTANRERIAERDREYYAANAERAREYRREYAAMNAEHIAEYQREYYAANTERIAEYKREYRDANRERTAERNRAYRQTDAGKAAMRAGSHRRRARKAGASGTYTPAELDAIRTAQTDKHGQLRCWRCGRPIKGTPHLDHWQPLKHGGSNDAGNLHFMHKKCNLEKGAKMPAEIGRLI